MKLCTCGNQVTRPHGRYCEECRIKRQGHGKGHNGGMKKGQHIDRERKIITLGGITRKIPCLCCEKPFESQWVGNRICPRCSNHPDDIRDQGRETRNGQHQGAA